MREVWVLKKISKFPCLGDGMGGGGWGAGVFLISESFVRFGWITPHEKAVMLFFQILCDWTPFMWYLCSRQLFFSDFRKNTSCGIIQSHLTSHSQIFRKKDRKWSMYFGRGPDLFLCWLDFILSKLWQWN